MIPEPRQISFYSDGHKLAGLLFLPDGAQACPGIVVPQGTVGLKEHYRYPELAGKLAAAGYATLIFDYRGFGESEGEKNRLLPLEQVEDIQNALTWLGAQQEVDAHALGLFGFCWGGTHAVYTGSIDSRVRCVIEVGGMADGARWLQSLRPYWDWRAFLRRLEDDHVRQTLTGQTEVVPLGEVLIGSPMAKEGRRRIKEEIAPASPPYTNPQLTLASARRILEYRPEQVVAQLASRPLLIVHGAEDDVVPLAEAEALYRAAAEPKELVIFPGAYHHDVYFDPLFGEILARALEWLCRWLPPQQTAMATAMPQVRAEAAGDR